MNFKRNTLKASAILAVAGIALTGCSNNAEYHDRKEEQKTTTLKTSLEKQNLEEKLKREEDPTTIRYVYVSTFGKPMGYYVIKGKVSSSGSQLAPEQEVIRFYGEGHILDSKKDDGSYGEGDPGIFFYTTDGALIDTNYDYMQSDYPLNFGVEVPLLGGDPAADKK